MNKVIETKYLNIDEGVYVDSISGFILDIETKEHYLDTCNIDVLESTKNFAIGITKDNKLVLVSKNHSRTVLGENEDVAFSLNKNKAAILKYKIDKPILELWKDGVGKNKNIDITDKESANVKLFDNFLYIVSKKYKGNEDVISLDKYDLDLNLISEVVFDSKSIIENIGVNGEIIVNEYGDISVYKDNKIYKYQNISKHVSKNHFNNKFNIDRKGENICFEDKEINLKNNKITELKIAYVSFMNDYLFYDKDDKLNFVNDHDYVVKEIFEIKDKTKIYKAPRFKNLGNKYGLTRGHRSKNNFENLLEIYNDKHKLEHKKRFISKKEENNIYKDIIEGELSLYTSERYGVIINEGEKRTMYIKDMKTNDVLDSIDLYNFKHAAFYKDKLVFIKGNELSIYNINELEKKNIDILEPELLNSITKVKLFSDSLVIRDNKNNNLVYYDKFRKKFNFEHKDVVGCSIDYPREHFLIMKEGSDSIAYIHNKRTKKIEVDREISNLLSNLGKYHTLRAENYKDKIFLNLKYSSNKKMPDSLYVLDYKNKSLEKVKLKNELETINKIKEGNIFITNNEVIDTKYFEIEIFKVDTRFKANNKVKNERELLEI